MPQGKALHCSARLGLHPAAGQQPPEGATGKKAPGSFPLPAARQPQPCCLLVMHYFKKTSTLNMYSGKRLGTVLVLIPTLDGAVSHFLAALYAKFLWAISGQIKMPGKPSEQPWKASLQTGHQVVIKSLHPGLTARNIPCPRQGSPSSKGASSPPGIHSGTQPRSPPQ